MQLAYDVEYEFESNGLNTLGLPVEGNIFDINLVCKDITLPNIEKGKYAQMVTEAQKSFKSGDLFEVVPSHTFHFKCELTPAQVFSNLKTINPSPYGFIINFGGEFLIGASPEMYVRVKKIVLKHVLFPVQ
jgi:anthranilate synthase